MSHVYTCTTFHITSYFDSNGKNCHTQICLKQNVWRLKKTVAQRNLLPCPWVLTRSNHWSYFSFTDSIKSGFTAVAKYNNWKVSTEIDGKKPTSGEFKSLVIDKRKNKNGTRDSKAEVWRCKSSRIAEVFIPNQNTAAVKRRALNIKEP